MGDVSLPLGGVTHVMGVINVSPDSRNTHTVARSVDGSASIDLTNDNAYAVLDALGIERDACGRIAVSDLRSIVCEPTVRTRMDRTGLGHYADQLERLARVERSEDEVHVVWG